MTLYIDVAIPTYESGNVISEALESLAESEEFAEGVNINKLVVIDNESGDNTVHIVNEAALKHDWQLTTIQEPTTLPEARRKAINEVETEWFLFLDDDVRIQPNYLQIQRRAICPAVGAIQGRQSHRTEPPADWVRRVSRRGGTMATLLRREAVADVSFPSDLLVLEDEWLRQHVEENGFMWVFNYRGVFEHDRQERHPIGWQEGWLAGKYGLKTGHEVMLNVPYSILSGRNPWPHVKRALGWALSTLIYDVY